MSLAKVTVSASCNKCLINKLQQILDNLCAAAEELRSLEQQDQDEVTAKFFSKENSLRTSLAKATAAVSHKNTLVNKL